MTCISFRTVLSGNMILYICAIVHTDLKNSNVVTDVLKKLTAMSFLNSEKNNFFKRLEDPFWKIVDSKIDHGHNLQHVNFYAKFSQICAADYGKSTTFIDIFLE